ncbi:hypothetical protein D9Q98_005508 [Chlorella vulgaris]|uniref:D-lactate dehydrogenase n=1 Tax=Chlorella vulgaris TaxID=3077 RepID=A0A9D4YW07_CHLVU|nr:hypothetical protein D9Q98_005508 [Chlorella vulgaris]
MAAGDGTGSKAFRIVVYSAQSYVLEFLHKPLVDAFGEDNVNFVEARLDKATAELAKGCSAACLFVNDVCDEEVVGKLADAGVKVIAMRCAGFDRVDLEAARRHGIDVVRVPTYSPRTVAEHAMALAYALARELKHQMQRMAAGNYTLNGVVGTQLSYKTYGVMGTGNIGIEMIKLLRAFEGRILCYDPYPSQVAKDLGVEYVELEYLLKESDLISLHCPLMPSTFHIMNEKHFNLMKPSCILINISRGGLIDTNALIAALEANKLAGVAMDVYEDEGNLFDEDFTDFSSRDRMAKWDRRWAYLKFLPQVIVTPHSAFLTHEALSSIAETTVQNLKEAAAGGKLTNLVKPKT